MRARVFAALSLSLIMATGASAQKKAAAGGAEKKRFGVAIAVDGPSDAYRTFTEMIRSEVADLLGDELALSFVVGERAQAGFSERSAHALVETLMTDPEVDAVVALGPSLVSTIAERATLEKPVILPLVGDPALSGLPRVGNRSGRENLNYIGGLDSMARDVARFREIVPHERTVVLVDAGFARQVKELDAFMRGVNEEVGGGVSLVPVGATADAIVQALPADTQGVVLGGIPALSWQELDRLLEALRARRLPTFTSLGPVYVERGVMATATPHEDWVRRARRVALHLQRIALGESAADLPVLFEPREALLINMEAARAVGVWPSFAMLTEAKLIRTGEGRKRRFLTLKQAVSASLTANLELLAERHGLRAGQETVAASRGRLLPQIQAEISAVQIEPDAASPLGPAERTLAWSVSASQLLYAEGAHTDVAVKDRLQDSREHDYRQRVLDLEFATASAYVDVLRAGTNESIRRQDLQRTRSHLELAEVRKAIGVGHPNEVYRWQNEIARSRRAVIDAVSVRNQAEIALNRFMHRPLEEPIELADLSPDDPASPLIDARLLSHLDNPWAFRGYREFMAQEAQRAAPEIAALDRAIAARERQLEGQRRSLYVPSIALVGGFTHELLTDGEGTEPLTLGPGGPSFDRNEFVWNVGLRASLPIFEGTTRYAGIHQTEHELAELRTRRRAAAEAIEQRVRSALHQAGASRPAIALTEQASEAAAKNLELVQDAYRSGALSVIDLIDAQTQALLAELAAADAKYRFMVDHLRAERAMGGFTFDRDPAARNALYHRLRSHIDRMRGADTPGALQEAP